MTTVAHVSRVMQTVLTTTAEQAAADLSFTQRPDVAKFTASTLVQTLVYGWLGDPHATREHLAQTAAEVGVDVAPQAIDQRLNLATATLLRTVLDRSLRQLVAGDPVAIPLLQRFAGVHVLDSTTIVLPDELAVDYRGCGGTTNTNTAAALKCGLRFDLLTGAVLGLDLVDGRAADRSLAIQHQPTPPGTLRIADLGFYDLAVFADIAANGGFWLSKLPANAVISTDQQPEMPLLTFIRGLGPVAAWDGTVHIGQGRRLLARLLLQRVPQEVADQRRRRIRQAARDKGRTPSAAALALADWTILITNLATAQVTLPEALVLMKVRWQIELIFKLWKSHGAVDRWRSSKPVQILCEVHAKLLGMLLQHWMFALSCWAYPDRSLVKAAKAVRTAASGLAYARGRCEQLADVLTTVQQKLTRTARMNSRSACPNTYQWLLDLTTEDPAHSLP